MTTREGIGLFGLLLASIIPTILFKFTEENQYNWLFVILLFLLMISLFVFVRWMKSSEIRKPKNLLDPHLINYFHQKKLN